MSDLFQRDKSTISRHIKNIFNEGELERTSTVAKFATVQNEDNRQVERVIEYYNLAKPYTFWQKINYPEKVDANRQNEKLLVKIAESPYTYLKVSPRLN